LSSEKLLKVMAGPATAMDLEPYLRSLIDDGVVPQWENGKVNPSKYGSLNLKDLGIFYETFNTISECRYGMHCPWRHHPLTDAESAWIYGLGGVAFFHRVERFWKLPAIPEPTSFPPFPYPQVSHPAPSQIQRQDADDQPSPKRLRRDHGGEDDTKSMYTTRSDRSGMNGRGNRGHNHSSRHDDYYGRWA
jgi:hypothetical protein